MMTFDLLCKENSGWRNGGLCDDGKWEEKKRYTENLNMKNEKK